MEVTGINCGVPFKAQVESQSPLVSGNWAYLSNQGTSADSFAPQKKKSGFWKKALIAAAAVVAVGIALAQTRKLSSIDAVMKKGSFKEVQGFGDKVKYVIGKGGDYAKSAYDCTLGKLFGLFKKKGAEAPKSDTPAPKKPKTNKKPPKAPGKAAPAADAAPAKKATSAADAASKKNPAPKKNAASAKKAPAEVAAPAKKAAPAEVAAPKTDAASKKGVASKKQAPAKKASASSKGTPSEKAIAKMPKQIGVAKGRKK